MDSQEQALKQGNEEVANGQQPVAEPAAEEPQAPVAVTEEAPAETPIEASAEASNEAPSEASNEASAETPVEATAEASAETPAEEASTEVVNEEAATTAAVEEAAAKEAPAKDTPAEERRQYHTKEEILARVREISQSPDTPQKDEVEMLKSLFYRMHFAEREAAQKAYIEAGGDPDAYQVTPDETEEAFKAEMQVIKERRQQLFIEQEKEKADNLEKKLAIIEKIKGMATTPEEAGQGFQEFKALQQQWREIGAVPPEKATELWRNYQLYVEQYYDLLKLNNEAREYDFKKNLEIKQRLCDAAEKLAEEEDVISAFHQLQKLHQEYRETGPVAKELREEVWNRFKAASTVINKRHQQHFEELRAREEENLAKKTALCERAEAVAAEENKGSADWEKHTQEMIALQQEWKTIGFAPQKMNVKIFERFRSVCDTFFQKKTEHFRQLKETFRENAEKKRALVEQAQALQDSTDWKATADKMVQLQKEWKTIGMVSKRVGDQLWADFQAACNHFFDQRNAAGSGQRQEERENLAKKREIVEQLRAAAVEAGDNVEQKVQELVARFNEIGHVPFRDKDKLYDEYHGLLDELRRNMNVRVAGRRLNQFKENVRRVAERGQEALGGERQKLQRQLEQLQKDLQTYENNLGFLSASSKKGNSLVDEMNRRADKIRQEISLVREKIKALAEAKKEATGAKPATAEPQPEATEPQPEATEPQPEAAEPQPEAAEPQQEA